MTCRLLALVLLPAVLGLAHCARGLPAVGLANKQEPVGGSPEIAWREVAGRCTVSTPSLRISCRAIVRRDAQGDVRLALLADEGVLLCDVGVSRGQVSVYREAPDLIGRGKGLGMLAWQAWGRHVTPVAGSWQDGAWKVEEGDWQRWFAGDPLALRLVEGPGPHCEVGDYHPWFTGILAYQTQLSGLGFTVNISLTRPLLDESAPGLNLPAANESPGRK